MLLNWDGGTEEGMSLAAGTKLGPYEIGFTPSPRG